MGENAHTIELSMMNCKACGADQHVEQHLQTLNCSFCGSILEAQRIRQEEWIEPGAILPFQLEKNKALELFQAWSQGLWLAPNNFKKAHLNPAHLQGVYLPFWTFDAQMHVRYSGQRGQYYYKNKRVAVKVNGQTQYRNRQVRKVRWTPCSGEVSGFVDDTLISATANKNKRQLSDKVCHWTLEACQPFDAKYLAGYTTEMYTLPLKKGHIEAKKEADVIAKNWAKNDIGGDTQRIQSLTKTLTKETFKHILLPMFMSHYNYEGKVYSLYINGQTGEIDAERPYSVWKIAFICLVVLLIVCLIYYLNQKPVGYESV